MAHLRHQHMMEPTRLYIAFLLVAVLFGVLVVGLFRKVSGADINQFAAPISGLAGIAVGWLFSGHDDRGADPGREEDVRVLG
jgi:hypothetical protein